MPLHLIKLAVGVDDLDEIRAFQARRKRDFGAVFTLTRMTPKRADELVDGGSLFWVVKRLVAGRQRILGVEEDRDDEGRRRCRLLLDAELVPVERRPHKPFQGWRYLDPAAAPPDRRDDADEPPPEMAAELRRLGLIY